ncbi:hypothetical protein VY88_12785 [Azospirillum thiophilum]|uniref:Uncharacterized protein n=1 Tax=Azospirillum thiophilum TaxID=528244 RepID=A0AAC8VYI9_9PROT|nr:hypothetical protein [Azospirillum thiophilum]ALG71833.1 hypothetical protein AL072_13955 [Azospirillum thiophilum]KJR66758.1 hypothetical protein VY88_12785 [Azospirillum thiophilum]
MSGTVADANRRTVLAGLAAGGACLFVAGGAQAITAQPRSDYGAMLDAACGATADHKRQIAAVESALGVTLPDERVAEVLRRTQCPSCGCPLALAAVGPNGGMGAF